MHVLVTGGCGFIGSHVALHLREKGHKASVMDNLVRRGSGKNVSMLERHGVSFFHGDVRNPEDLVNLPSSIELICDTSAQPSAVTGYANPVFDITNNGLGTIHILEYAPAPHPSDLLELEPGVRCGSPQRSPTPRNSHTLRV